MIFDSICPVNVAEATLDHFFDPDLSSLPLYEVEDLAGSGACASQFWCNIKIALPAGRSGPQIRMSRRCAIDAFGYDRFVLRASLPKSALLDVALDVGGRRERVIHEAAGVEDLREYEGAFNAKRLEAIEITISRTDGMVTVANIEWTLLASAERRGLLAHDWPAYDATWGGYLREEVPLEEIRPDIGFTFDDAGLEALRRKVARPEYRGIYAELRKLAESHRHDEPERHIGRVNQPQMSRYARDSQLAVTGGPGRFAEAARVLGFVGLVERDAGLLRTAARIALSQAMCGHWRGWLDTHPMSTWEHRAFQQYRTAVGCSFALDWAGCMLTDYGKHVITCAIAEKGLADIQTCFMRHPYVRGNNQGFFFAWGWIVSVLAIEKRWPRAIEWLEHPKEILVETLRSYLLEDGGADEGIGYLTGSLNQCLEGLYLYGRRTGTDAASLLPPAARNIAAYVSANISTVPPDGSVVPIADGGRVATPPQRLTLAQLANLTGDERAAELYSFLSKWPIAENAASPGAVFEIIHGPEALPRVDLPIPAFARFPVSGMMSSLRREGDRSVRLFLVGGKAIGGHSHDDRGSLIVEIDRQNAIVDGSQIQYSDPQAEIMKYALFHNLLTPGALEETGVRQRNPCPVATIVQGTGDETRLDCSIDVSGAWYDPVVSAIRRVRSERLDSFVLEDTMELAARGPVTLRLNALVPFIEREGAWELPLEGVVLRIAPGWKPSRRRMERIGVDGAKRPVYQLMLEAPEATAHRLTTRFSVVWVR